MTKLIFSHIMIVLLFVFVLPSQIATAQDRPSGALDAGLFYEHGMKGANVLGVHGRAMAVDRVPDSVVGRFGELYMGFGAELEGRLFTYQIGAKLGVGLGTDYFVVFIASGMMLDGRRHTKKAGKSMEVKPGFGLPLLVGVWIDPIPELYFYAIAEPSWAFGASGRATKPFIPFNFARELRLRGGFGVDLFGIHMRIDYTFHQLKPQSWHTISIGFGPPSAEMRKFADSPTTSIMPHL